MPGTFSVPGAAIALVTAARQDGREPDPAPDPERARPLWSVELVARQREQVDAERPDIDRNLASGLDRIGMKERAVRVRDAGQFVDRLHRADLVVRVHHRHDRGHRCRSRPRAPRASRRRRVVDGQKCAVISHDGREAARVEDRFVLDRGRHEMPDACAPPRPRRRREREVVGLGAAGREHNLGGVGADELGHATRARRPARPSPADRSAWTLEALPKVSASARGHRLDDFRMPAASWRCNRSRCARSFDHSIAANPQQ